MEVFISSDANQKEFINASLEEIEAKKEDAGKLSIEIKSIYSPWNIGRRPTNVLERIIQIKDAAIVLMNVTPTGSIKRDGQDIPVLNSGVCIEFGILIGINRLEKCHLFCSNEFDRGQISPIFHGEHIDSFAPKKPDELRKIMGSYFDDYFRVSTNGYEKYVAEESSTERYGKRT